jgi:hypothetical protein
LHIHLYSGFDAFFTVSTKKVNTPRRIDSTSKPTLCFGEVYRMR